ncbi:MAG: hypothetical protein ACM359_14210 [Bacillota bacterium]
MTDNQKLEQELVRLGKTLTPPPFMADAVMRRVEALPLPQPTFNTTRRWLMRTSIGLAAGLTIATVLWLTLMGSSTPLYAQVDQALKEVRTLHAVAYVRDNGQWAQKGEIWYELGVGIAVAEKRAGRLHRTVDDGKTLVQQVEGEQPISEPSKLDFHSMMTEALNLGAFRDNVDRDPSGDRPIQGTPCKSFLSLELRQQGREGHRFWIDTNNWVRRMERGVFREGQWQPNSALEVAYDVPIDRSHFKVDLSGQKVIEPQRARDALLSLDGALFKTEKMGLIFAVHQVKRCEGNLIFTLCSIRPSVETRKQYGRSRWGIYQQLCDYQLDGSWKRINGEERWYQPCHLASLDPNELSAEGIYAGWWLLIPKGVWREKVQTWEVGVNVYCNGPLGEDLQKQGKPWHGTYRDLASLPLPDAETSLQNLVDNLHADAKTLSTPISMVHLYYATERSANGELFRRSALPGKLSKEKFLDEVRREIEYLKKPLQ